MAIKNNIQLVLICLFFSYLPLWGQKLSLFEDYSKCATGFLKDKDTVYPAKFYSYEEIYRYQSYKPSFYQHEKAWILSENEKFGCLSEEGTWIIPCMYDELTYQINNHVFIAKLNGFYGLIDEKNQIIFPFEYEEIQPQFYFIDTFLPFIFQKNGKKGLAKVDTSQNFIIPLIYSDIVSFKIKRKLIEEENILYFVENEQGIGVLNENGEILINPEYKSLNVTPAYNEKDSSRIFIAKNHQGQTTLLTEFNKELLPFVQERVVPIYTSSVKGENFFENYVLLIDSLENWQMLNLKTKEKSLKYDKIIPLNQKRFVSFNDQKWQLLDSNFSVIYQNENSNEILLVNDIVEFDEYIEPSFSNNSDYFNSISIPHNFENNSAMLIIKSETTLPKRKQKRLNKVSQVYYGLLNTETKQCTSIDYDDVSILHSDKVLWFWAIRNTNVDSLFVADIYNKNGVLVRTISINEEEWNQAKENSVFEDSEIFWNIQKFVLVFRDRSLNKMALIHPNGKRISPYIFDSEPTITSYLDDSSGVLRFFDTYSSWFTDFQGNALLEGRHFKRVDFNYVYKSHDSLSPICLQINNNLFTMVNEKFEIILDSCAYLSNVSFDTNVNLPRGSYLVTIKDDYVYFFQGTKAHILDSSYFHNPNSENKVGKDLYVNPDGKKMEKRDPIIYRSPKFTFTLYENTLTIEKIKGNIHQEIKGVKSYQVLSKLLMIIELLDGKKGVLEMSNGQWIVEPKWKFIQPMDKDRIDFFWVKDVFPEVPESKWYVIKSDGSTVTKPIFDKPISIITQNHQIFTSNNKFGIVCNDFSIPVQPIYDDVISVHGIYKLFLLKGQTFLFNQDRNELLPIKMDFINKLYKNGYLLYANDSIQFISSDGNVTIPKTSTKDAIVNYDLGNVFFGTSDLNLARSYVLNGVVFCSKNDSVLRKYNNQVLIDEAKSNVVSFQNRYRNKTSESHCKTEPLYLFGRYYSERVIGDCFGLKKQYSSYTKQTSAYRNYYIDSTEIRLIQLVDFFKPNSNYEKRLNDLIEKQIQERQLFGIVCIDLPAKIEQFKQNFYLENSYLIFVHSSEQLKIKIPLSSLNDILNF